LCVDSCRIQKNDDDDDDDDNNDNGDDTNSIGFEESPSSVNGTSSPSSNSRITFKKGELRSVRLSDTDKAGRGLVESPDLLFEYRDARD
jgi:hypothetical protein